jgi:hypothetical protein
MGRDAPFYHRLADRCRTRASILNRRLVSDAAPVQILRMAVAMRKAHTSIKAHTSMRSQREQMRQVTRVEECADASQAVSFRASRRPIRQYGCRHSQPSIGFRCSALRSHGKPPPDVWESSESREKPLVIRIIVRYRTILVLPPRDAAPTESPLLPPQGV